MPEVINGITVPEDGDPTTIPGDLQRFATDLGEVLAEHLDLTNEEAAAAGAEAAVGYASGLDDAKINTVLQNPTSAAGNTIKASYARSGVDATQRLMAILKNETADTSMLVVGDSTGNETTEWVYLLAGQIADDWPTWTVLYRLWNDGAGAYDSAVTIQTGTGSRTLTIYNASVAGFTSDSWLGSRADTALYALDPKLVVISLGHNEQIIAAELWHGRYVALTESISDRLPGADLLTILQNPATANTRQQERAEIYREIATRRGYGLIDVQQAFLDTPSWQTALIADGIHPNTAGSQLWAATVKPAFTYQPNLPPRPQKPSSFTEAAEQLLVNGDFSAFGSSVPDAWQVTNATCSKDTTNYESANGYSCKVTATGAGASLYQYIPISRAKGRWVTVAVRIRVPAGSSTSTTGRVAITDSNGSSTQLGYGDNTGAMGRFRWVVVSRYVAATATNCRVLIYADTAGSGNVSIDRVIMTTGKFPHAAANAQPGPAGPSGSPSITQMDHLSTLGTSPALTMAGNTQFVLGSANQAICVPVIPHRNMTLAKLRWMPGVVSGNYDIAILDASGTRLWSKGSTALTSGAKTEDVSPGLALTAGTKYWVALALDNTTAQAYGLSAVVAAHGTMEDGTAFARTVSSAFPIPSTVTLGSTGSAKIPVVVLSEA